MLAPPLAQTSFCMQLFLSLFSVGNCQREQKAFFQCPAEGLLEESRKPFKKPVFVEVLLVNRLDFF